MQLFVEVARACNFSKAAVALGIPTSTVSRRIGAMEKDLGVRLFERSTRRVVLTDVARAYFGRCASVVDQARQADDELRTKVETPSGTVRLTAPVDLGLHWIGPMLPQLLRRLPGIRLAVDLSPRHADLAGDRFDIALRIGEVRVPHLVCRTLGTISQGLYAAPGYLASRGIPTALKDLPAHTCLLLGEQPGSGTWRLCRAGKAGQDVPMNARLSLNNVGLLRQMLENGLGVGALPRRLAAESVATGRLTPVLPDYHLPALPVQALTSSRLQPAAVRAVMRHLVDHFEWD